MLTPITNVPATMTVTKGCDARGIRKGQRATNITVTAIEGTGYRVSFTIGGKTFVMWAASSARFAGGQYSLNTGNPLQRVVMAG